MTEPVITGFWKKMAVIWCVLFLGLLLVYLYLNVFLYDQWSRPSSDTSPLFGNSIQIYVIIGILVLLLLAKSFRRVVAPFLGFLILGTGWILVAFAVMARTQVEVAEHLFGIGLILLVNYIAVLIGAIGIGLKWKRESLTAPPPVPQCSESGTVNNSIEGDAQRVVSQSQHSKTI